jgi:hypothetical protein
MQNSEGSTVDKTPSSSLSPAKRRLSFQRPVEEIDSCRALGPTSQTTQTPSSASPTQAKRRKVIQSSGTAVKPEGSMSKIRGQVARPDVVYLSKNFQPQVGIRKLVIKNVRKAAVVSLQDHYDQIWAQVSAALRSVYAGQQPEQPLERLYRYVEDLCRNGMAEKLFHHLNTECTAYLQNSLLPHISSQIQPGLSPVKTLRILHTGWRMWNSRSVGDPSTIRSFATDFSIAESNTIHFWLPGSLLSP